MNYIELQGIVWDEGEPGMPEDVILELDDEVYAELVSEDSENAWEYIIDRVTDAFGYCIREIDGWDDLEGTPENIDVRISY